MGYQSSTTGFQRRNQGSFGEDHPRRNPEHDRRKAKVTDHNMTVLRQKNISDLKPQVPAKDVMRVEIIDDP